MDFFVPVMYLMDVVASDVPHRSGSKSEMIFNGFNLVRPEVTLSAVCLLQRGNMASPLNQDVQNLVLRAGEKWGDCGFVEAGSAVVVRGWSRPASCPSRSLIPRLAQRRFSPGTVDV
jgi:hypothetical protein